MDSSSGSEAEVDAGSEEEDFKPPVPSNEPAIFESDRLAHLFGMCDTHKHVVLALLLLGDALACADPPVDAFDHTFKKVRELLRPLVPLCLHSTVCDELATLGTSWEECMEVGCGVLTSDEMHLAPATRYIFRAHEKCRCVDVEPPTEFHCLLNGMIHYPGGWYETRARLSEFEKIQDAYTVLMDQIKTVVKRDGRRYVHHDFRRNQRKAKRAWKKLKSFMTVDVVYKRIKRRRTPRRGSGTRMRVGFAPLPPQHHAITAMKYGGSHTVKISEVEDEYIRERKQNNVDWKNRMWGLGIAPYESV
jgi:hypothetical protein